MPYEYLFLREMLIGWEWKVSPSTDPDHKPERFVGYVQTGGWQPNKGLAIEAAKTARQEIQVSTMPIPPMSGWHLIDEN